MIKDQKDSGEVYVMGTLAFEEVKQIVKEEIKKQAPSAEPPTDLRSSAVSSSPISFGSGEAPQGRSDSNSEFGLWFVDIIDVNQTSGLLDTSQEVIKPPPPSKSEWYQT